jgi:hypothetical protein
VKNDTGVLVVNRSQDGNVVKQSKAAMLRAFAETLADPVFKRSVCMIADALELAQTYKRIDMAFLQMTGENGIPKFALQPLKDYRERKVCRLSMETGYTSGDDTKGRFSELFVRGKYFGQVETYSMLAVPETIAASVAEVEDRFEEVFVVWEADWQPQKGDPIIIGRLGTYYYMLAKWDMTDLETFVVGAMVEP